MLTILLTLLLLQPNYPHKAASPPQPVASQPSAIDQLSPQQRRIINERAKDFYLIPGTDTYADAWRLHRIRELLAKGGSDYKKIPIAEAMKLGMGHTDNQNETSRTRFGPSAPLTNSRDANHPQRPTYKDLPNLITITHAEAGIREAIIICEAPHLGDAPPASGLISAATPELETSARCITTIPHKVTIVQILDEHNAIAKISYIKNMEPPGGIPKEGFHITAPTTGLRDAQVYPGDFILIPQGQEHYKNFAGVRATTASYQLIPLTTPVTPEDLATAIRDGKATINTYTCSARPGNAYEWKSAPIKFIFKP